ncbi:hypothetical protein AcW1_006718 [Taiwanofungus camphoratus]|nr:hypothetical protein AcW1_006718 [Antrodia cinnamomea]
MFSASGLPYEPGTGVSDSMTPTQGCPTIVSSNASSTVTDPQLLTMQCTRSAVNKLLSARELRPSNQIANQRQDTTTISSISKPHKQASFRGIPPTEESLVDVPKPPNTQKSILLSRRATNKAASVHSIASATFHSTTTARILPRTTSTSPQKSPSYMSPTTASRKRTSQNVPQSNGPGAISSKAVMGSYSTVRSQRIPRKTGPGTKTGARVGKDPLANASNSAVADEMVVEVTDSDKAPPDMELAAAAETLSGEVPAIIVTSTSGGEAVIKEMGPQAEEVGAQSAVNENTAGDNTANDSSYLSWAQDAILELRALSAFFSESPEVSSRPEDTVAPKSLITSAELIESSDASRSGRPLPPIPKGPPISPANDLRARSSLGVLDRAFGRAIPGYAQSKNSANITLTRCRPLPNPPQLAKQPGICPTRLVEGKVSFSRPSKAFTLSLGCLTENVEDVGEDGHADHHSDCSIESPLSAEPELAACDSTTTSNAEDAREFGQSKDDKQPHMGSGTSIIPSTMASLRSSEDHQEMQSDALVGDDDDVHVIDRISGMFSKQSYKELEDESLSLSCVDFSCDEDEVDFNWDRIQGLLAVNDEGSFKISKHILDTEAVLDVGAFRKLWADSIENCPPSALSEECTGVIEESIEPLAQHTATEISLAHQNTRVIPCTGSMLPFTFAGEAAAPESAQVDVSDPVSDNGKNRGKDEDEERGNVSAHMAMSKSSESLITYALFCGSSASRPEDSLAFSCRPSGSAEDVNSLRVGKAQAAVSTRKHEYPEASIDQDDQELQEELQAFEMLLDDAAQVEREDDRFKIASVIFACDSSFLIAAETMNHEVEPSLVGRTNVIPMSDGDTRPLSDKWNTFSLINDYSPPSLPMDQMGRCNFATHVVMSDSATRPLFYDLHSTNAENNNSSPHHVMRDKKQDNVNTTMSDTRPPSKSDTCQVFPPSMTSALPQQLPSQSATTSMTDLSSANLDQRLWTRLLHRRTRTKAFSSPESSIHRRGLTYAELHAVFTQQDPDDSSMSGDMTDGSTDNSSASSRYLSASTSNSDTSGPQTPDSGWRQKNTAKGRWDSFVSLFRTRTQP